MQLNLTPEDEAFRDEVRDFLKANLPGDVIRRSRTGMHPPNEDDRRWWNRILHDKGWAAPHWPEEYGGTGWSHLRTHIFEYESWLAGAPELRWQGLRLLGPVLYTFGSPEQKARYLPAILKGEEMWAQGFSEPGAGSDLASLKTSAILDGDHYIINGQKLWTTEGQYCEQGFFLVRTENSDRPQKGISMIIIDMRTPGVTVRQIPMINGEGSTCEVFLDNVRVPRENLIGQPGSAWTQAKFLLSNERTSSADLYKARGDLERIRTIASQELKDGRPLLEDSNFARRFGTLRLEVEALEWSVLRVMHEAPSRHPIAACASVLKVRGSSLQQKLTEMMVEALGQRSLRQYRRDEAYAEPTGNPLWPAYTPGVTTDLMYLRACTIYGGAMEVQKNIIAKLAFGF
ncbi:acyl-CoA dehydrogenase family protein [Metapseudomonas resinovorans]|uniref:Putative acyl-CoA dehydrogenase n=1 Tax=Metapseudomonas resinovorans NBRC 106553 TaxID=1245471 RepID=S6AJE0_METRE|nr:acyl-CoA dehydrogenase family protein [Pseudomonas resinovorans]BAN48575.1 putative acyl-CoA dehydrogenase [Pseudomonas resinovorans NBRC 106553]